MDRQAKLSRLRFLVAELVEQLGEPQFDTPRQFDLIHWSEIVTSLEEIERRRSAVGVGPVLSVEVEGRVCGRVKAWRPSGRSVVESMVVHPSGGGPLWKSLWDVLRKPEVVDNLRRWVRFIDHLLTQDAEGVVGVWSQPMTVDDAAKQRGVKPRTINRWFLESTGPVEVRRTNRGWYQFRERRQ